MYWELSIQQKQETPVYVVHHILGATSTKISHLLSLKKNNIWRYNSHILSDVLSFSFHSFLMKTKNIFACSTRDPCNPKGISRKNIEVSMPCHFSHYLSIHLYRDNCNKIIPSLHKTLIIIYPFIHLMICH